jgi:hypothetical protein
LQALDPSLGEGVQAVVSNITVISLKGQTIVVPVNRHGQGITDVQTVQGSP